MYCWCSERSVLSLFSIMDVASPQNRTGIYPGYGVYTPPYERKSTFPRMLYRGHAIKVSRGDQDSVYQQHVVKRYQMHSLNAGFSGKDCIPIKDQNNFKVPAQRSFCPGTPRGKWTNYPMTVELGKYTRGFEGVYDSKPVTPGVKEKPKSPPARARTTISSMRRSIDIPSRPLPSPLDFNTEARLYEEMEPEIIDIMAARNEVFLSFQNRVESALLNDSDRTNDLLNSNPVSRLGFVPMMSDMGKPSKQRSRPKTTSFFIEDANSNLLLPVPYVLPQRDNFKSKNKQRSYSAPVIALQ